jgi:hypothetical protein
MEFRKKTTIFVLLILVNCHAFASNDLISGMSRLNIGDFLIFSGKEADREQMLANNFDLPGFTLYNRGKLINAFVGDNYHVFKTFFTISDEYANKNLTLYISHFDMPVIIRINGTVIFKRGLRQESDAAYSTGGRTVTDIPLFEGLIDYNKENFLVIEGFPQYETSPLPILSIADYKDNAIKMFIKNLFHVYLVIAAQFVALLVAIYHFAVFISRGCKDPKYIIFAFLSFSFALAYANIGFSWDSNYYIVIEKITRCFQLLSVSFFALFVIETSGLFVKQKKYIITGIITYSAICAAYIAFQRDKYAVNAAFSVMSGIY